MWELTGNIFQDRYIPPALVLSPTTLNDKKFWGLTMGAHVLKEFFYLLASLNIDDPRKGCTCYGL
eukprot:8996161-Ditylum_brightwellii.AAC.1